MHYSHRSLLALCLLSLPVACADDSTSGDAEDAQAPAADASATGSGTTTQPSTTEPSTPDASGEPSTPTDAGDEPTTLPEPAPTDAGNASTEPPDAASTAPVVDGGSPPSDAATRPDAAAPDAASATDAAPQTDASTPEPDAGGGPGTDPWAACPAAADFESDESSPLTLQVTDDAVFCATFQETRTLKEELAAKAQLRFTPGTYSLPNQATPSSVWPVCLRIGDSAGVGPSAGSSDYSTSSFEQSITHTVTATQSFAALGGGELNLRIENAFDDGSSPGYVLDGTEVPFENFDAYRSLEWCSVPEQGCFPDRIFDSCQHDSGQLNRHEVSLDTGNVVFELRIGQSFAGTEPGAYVRASGSFNGRDFEQTDYFKLIYHPAHHHFERAFVVLFDQPIDGACGIEVSALEPFDDLLPDEAYTVDCELNRIDALSVEDHTLIRD